MPRAYRKDGYTLYARTVRLRGGKEQTLYFFARGRPRNARPTVLPDGYEAVVPARGDVPVLELRARKAAAAARRA